MDDTSQTNPNSSNTVNAVQNNVNYQTDQQVSIGQIQKERELSSGDFSPELITSSEPEPTLDKEVSEAGVEKVDHLPQLSAEEKNIGIRLAKEATPVSTEPLGTVQLPMTQQQAQQVLKKNKNVTDSLVWLAILVVKQFQKMHGKIVGN